MSRPRAILIGAAAAVVVLVVAAPTAANDSVGGVAVQPLVVPLHSSSASARRDWFWSKKAAQLTLLDNGIYWPQTRQKWIVGFANCMGLGHWIIRRHVPRFRNFYCRVAASVPKASDSVDYNVIVHVRGRSHYRLSYAGPWQGGTWKWTAQHAADALVRGDIAFVGGWNDVLESSCSPFGQRFVSGGYDYYRLFYCAIKTSTTQPYAVVTRVVDRDVAVSIFVSYLDELPFTPAVPQPTPSSNTSNQQLWAWFQSNLIGLNMIQDGYKRQNRIMYGSNYAPTGADIIAGAADCPSHPFSGAPFRSYGVC